MGSAQKGVVIPQPRTARRTEKPAQLYMAVLSWPLACKCGALRQLGDLVLKSNGGLAEACKDCAKGAFP